MYDFFEKLVKIVLPRVKDFSGIKEESLDQSGNLTIGFSEQTAFPEIDPGKVERIRGLEVTIVTNAKDKAQAKVLLEEMGIPFRK
jgi:large subunit ribosomal protein L5